jgi:cytoskeletal protein CcmA (bactofilin family)
MAIFNKETAARADVRSAPGSEGALSIIASSVRIIGDIESPGVVKIDGQVEGSVTGARQLLLGRGAAIRGNVAADEIVIGGLVEGSIAAAERLELQSTAVVNGDIEARSIIMLEGARVNGSVRMTDLVTAKTVKPVPVDSQDHEQLRIAT